MEVKRTWKRIIAALLTFVMALTFIPNIPALAGPATIDPATDEWVDYRGTDCVTVNNDNDASRVYGDTGTYSISHTYSDNEAGDFELYFVVNGDTINRNNSKNRARAPYADDTVVFEATANGENISISISNTWDAPVETYRWTLYEQDDDDDTSTDDPITSGTFTISPRSVTVYVWPIDMYYGENNKTIQYKYTVDGLVPGDTPESVIANVYSSAEGTVPNANHTVAMTKHTVGKIDTKVDGNKASNYNISFDNTQNFNISPINLGDLTVDFGATAKEYNGEDFKGQPKFVYNGKEITLDKDVDYTLYWKKEGNSKKYAYPNTAGKYTAIFEAKSDNVTGNNKGVNYEVKQKSLTISPKNYVETYTGDSVIIEPTDPDYKEKTISVEGLADNDEIVYTLEYEDNDTISSTYTINEDDEKESGTREITLEEYSLRRKDTATCEPMKEGVYDDIKDSYIINVTDTAELTIEPSDDYDVVTTGIDENYDKLQPQSYSIDITVTNNVAQSEPLKIEISTDNGETWTEWSEWNVPENNSYTDITNEEVLYRVAADNSNYVTQSGTISIKISGSEQNDASVTIEGWTYGEDPETPVVKNNDGEEIALDGVEIKYAPKIEDKIEYEQFADDAWDTDASDLDAGEYWIKATVPAYGTYADTDVYGSFTIEKKSVQLTINDFDQYYNEAFDEINYNSSDNLSRYTGGKKFVVDVEGASFTDYSVISVEEYYDDVTDSYKLIPTGINGVADEQLLTARLAEINNALGNNYKIDSLDDITPGTINIKPVNIADQTKVNITLTGIDAAEPDGEGGFLYEWTGNPVSIDVESVQFSNLETLIRESSTADPKDYDVQYYSIDEETGDKTLLTEAPKDIGKYVLVVKGLAADPSNADSASDSAIEGARVYGEKEINFEITPRIIHVRITAVERDYRYKDLNVGLTIDDAWDYNGDIDLSTKEAIATELKLHGVMKDDAAGYGKGVIIYGANEPLEEKVEIDGKYTIVIDNPTNTKGQVTTTVNIAPAELEVEFKIGESEDEALTEASWQYGSYVEDNAKTFVIPKYQVNPEDETDIDTSNDFKDIAYQYEKVTTSSGTGGSSSQTNYQDIQLNDGESIEDWIGELEPGTYNIVAIVQPSSDDYNNVIYNYSSGTSEPITVTVSKRQIKVIANEQYRYYLDDNAFVTNLENEEAYTIVHINDEGEEDTENVIVDDNVTIANVITGTPSCSVTQERTLDTGSYPISLSNVNIAEDYADKYELTSKVNNFKILPLPLDNVYPDEYPQVCDPVRTVTIQLEKDKYVYDGSDKKPSYSVVYATEDGSASITVPVEQYKANYVDAETLISTNPKEPGDYIVYVLRADGKNNLTNVGKGEFTIKLIDIKVTFNIRGSKIYDGTDEMVIENYNVNERITFSWLPNEDAENYTDIEVPEDAISEIQEANLIFTDTKLPSKNVGSYGEDAFDDFDKTSLDEQFETINDKSEYYHYTYDFSEEYVVEKKDLSAESVTVSGTENVVYDSQAHEIVLEDKESDEAESIIEVSDYVVSYGDHGNINAGTVNYTIEANPDGNYTGRKEGSFEIAQKTLTITPGVLETRPYDNTDVMNVTTKPALVGVEEGDEVILQAVDYESVSIGNENKDASEDDKVYTYNNLELSGAAKDNYTLGDTTTTTAVGKITKKDVTVASNFKLTDKTYDGNATMAVTGSATAEGLIASDGTKLTGADAKSVTVSSADAGDKTYTFKFDLSGDAKDNYNLVTTSADATGKINKKDVTVTSTLKLTDKDYDGNANMAVTGSATAEGLVASDGTKLAGADAKTVTVSSAEAGDKTYTFKLSLTGDAAKNYNLKTTSVTATGKIEPVKTVDMHRLYNPNSGEHFYTANVAEKDNLVAAGWKYEGIGWKAPVTSNTPVYRLYNKNSGEHHYTRNVAERDMLIAAGWKNEGIGWYSDDNEGVALYRQYNPNAKTGTHNYTANKSENDWLISLGWRGEGIGWYGVK